MSEVYKPPNCTSCNKTIVPYEKSVKFPCPSCGVAIIWRCEKCKNIGRKYVCPNCGFVGP